MPGPDGFTRTEVALKRRPNAPDSKPREMEQSGHVAAGAQVASTCSWWLSQSVFSYRWTVGPMTLEGPSFLLLSCSDRL